MALGKKDRSIRIRATYEVQVRNVYDAMMYEEQACMS